VAKYTTPQSRIAFVRQVDEALRALPGATDVAYTTQLPLTGSGPLFPFAYNEATARNWESETSDVRGVSPAFFRALGTRVLAGRVFDSHDTPQQNKIVVDETLAARAWPGESAVGKRLQTGPTGTSNNFSEVIGVVEHVRIHDLTRAVRPQVYRPLGGVGRLDVVVRTSGDPAAIAPLVDSTIKGLDPDLPLDRVRPMRALVADALAPVRLGLLVMAGFGAVALLLSCVGVYGVFSYAVSQRTREIGIRMALGQDRHGVRNQVLAEGVRLTAISAGLGLAAAAAVSRALSSSLYGVQPLDPLTFALMPLLLAAVALLGCYLPARRATRVDPIVALKSD
jgi:putative ABC transport system permease protein